MGADLYLTSLPHCQLTDDRINDHLLYQEIDR